MHITIVWEKGNAGSASISSAGIESLVDARELRAAMNLVLIRDIAPSIVQLENAEIERRVGERIAEGATVSQLIEAEIERRVEAKFKEESEKEDEEGCPSASSSEESPAKIQE